MRRTGRTALGCLLAGWFLLAAVPAIATDKKAKAQATLFGNVFRDSGFALRGAEVVVTPEPAPKKKVEWRAIADARGEFLLRLPGGPASYNVIVRAPGFTPREKNVIFAGDERLDFTFLMSPVKEKP
jgi:hypothetical protein